MKRFAHALLLTACAALPSTAAFAQAAPPAADEHAAHHAPAATAQPVSEGEVRAIDTKAGKITLRHGPLTNLDMAGMTMTFTAADPAMLQGLKTGDKVRFTAEKRDGRYVVVELQAQP